MKPLKQGKFNKMDYSGCLKEIGLSRKNFLKWKSRPIPERIKCIRKISLSLKKRKLEYARIITSEMGKPISESVKEIEKCAWLCDYFADNAEGMLKDELVESEMKKSYVAFEPLGVILGIMPWNFPFWQVFRFAIPALLAGNACILKHSSNVPLCSSTIEKIFNSGIKGIFRNFLISSKTAMRLIAHVDGVAFTGSVGAGREVAEVAGRNLKKCVLELGGSDPFIVLEDADLKLCCAAAIKARMLNTGQSCIAAKRFIVVKGISKDFETQVLENMKSLKIGNSLDESTNLGPLARPEFLMKIGSQVNDAISRGAKVLYGGRRMNGNYYMPTLLSNVNEKMRVFNEETFGPVIPIIVVNNEKEAIAIANSTRFGLGASIWSRNINKAESLARQIQSGSVFINGIVRSDPRLPFGGIRDSGFGRELSHYGIKEFVNIKTVVIDG